MRLIKFQKLKVCLVFTVLIFSIKGYSQSVNEVLKDGIVVKKDEKIFIFRSGSTFLYDVSKAPANFNVFQDSNLFLLHNKGVNIFLPPLNPLRYSYDTATSIIADPIMDDADKAFASISSLLINVVEDRPRPGSTQTDTTKKAKQVCDCPKCDFKDIVDQVNMIVQKLDNDMKERIKTSFITLRNISFEQQKRTRDTINQIKDSIGIYKNFYHLVDSNITILQKGVNKFKCSKDDSLIIKYVLVQILKELKSTYNTQKTRLDNLLKAYALCDKAASDAESPSPIGHIWYESPINVGVVNKKITVVTIIVNYAGLEIKDDEIVSTPKKSFVKYTIRFRKFQRFIPEISAGIAFTHLKYPKYGTVTDAAGQLRVAEAGEEEFRKLNLTGMVNFVCFIKNWDINPVFQIGVGANTEYPVLFTGVGLRLNLENLRRVTLTVGGASSWIKALSKLNVNDPIKGTADLESDYIYEFKTPKIYFGIQYNF